MFFSCAMRGHDARSVHVQLLNKKGCVSLQTQNVFAIHSDQHTSQWGTRGSFFNCSLPASNASCSGSVRLSYDTPYKHAPHNIAGAMMIIQEAELKQANDPDLIDFRRKICPQGKIIEAQNIGKVHSSRLRLPKTVLRAMHRDKT